MVLVRRLFQNLFRRGSESGTAAIEFGLFIPVLLILLTGTVELGFLMYEAMQVNNAVEAGMLYAGANGWDAPSGSNIATAVVTAGVLPTGLNTLTATPAPTQFCGCPTATGITNLGAPTSGSCGSFLACADGTTPGTYVQVNAALTHTVIIPTPTSWGIPATLTATAVIRIN
jgi:Flp pilus assembly protein TadG